MALVREGRAEALMKGSLHTDELMAAVVKRDTGLRTARRVSHCFVMDVPGHDDTLIVTDAAVNIAPTLADKVDIVQNAIDLAHALGMAEVRVAILSAMETVNPGRTLDDRGGRALVQDGRPRPDYGRDPRRSAGSGQCDQPGGGQGRKKIVSDGGGRANVLVVPNLEAGNMLAKSLTFLAGADATGSCSAHAYRRTSPVAPTRAIAPARLVRGRGKSRAGASCKRGKAVV